MKKFGKSWGLIVALSALSGCVNHSDDYYLVNSFGFDTVCLVDNKNVPPSFFIALHKALIDKGLKVNIVNKTTNDPKFCPATAVYEAKYTSSGAYQYLSDARVLLIQPHDKTEIVNLKKPETPVPLLDKMADSEPAIRDMVNRLLPRNTPW